MLWILRICFEKVVTIHSLNAVNSNGFAHANRLRRWDEPLYALLFGAAIAQQVRDSAVNSNKIFTITSDEKVKPLFTTEFKKGIII